MAGKGKSNKSSGKGTSSFGKRTDAENSFHKAKKRSGRGEFEGGDKRSSRSSSSDKPREFRPRTSGSAGFRPRPDGESRGGFKKPYGKREDSSSDRPKRFSRSEDTSSDKPGRFSKPQGRGGSFGDRENKRSYTRREDSTDRPGFTKPRYGRSEGSDERPKRFSKPEGEKRSFGDRDNKRPYTQREDSSERPKRFSKPAFSNRDERSGEDKPKRFSKSFSRNEGDKKPFKKAGEKKSFVQAKTENQRNQIAGNVIERKSDDGLIRLNKFISNSGVCSRREADELIKMGLISVNGETITEMGYKVKPTDEVRHEGKKLKAEKPVYVLLNKPKGFITTTDDPQERNTVMSLVASACKERIYPVGRLDRNTTGLLLLTNDGDLTDKLTHPSYNAKKIYKVELDKPITKNDFQKVVDGVQLEEGKAIVDDAAIVSDDEKTVGIEIHIGWNRVVRRIFETLGYEVVKLDRVVYAGLDKKDLKRGQWRFLKSEEIVMLKHFK
ncbi:MAG: pseudouridylate synthase [Azospira oryzae]|jgi:23S rRNA pseudouridine2605 synthase|nr:MAG: pseudouridylate synthase [Azospira oryzae]